MKTTKLLMGALATALLAGQAAAADLTIGVAAEPSSIDPHYHNLGPNNEIRRHMFESLVWQDEAQRLSPWLATAWTPTSNTTWEFKLRQGVTFHDGSEFDAYDVIYTACRIPNVPNSPSSFVIYTKAIAAIEVPDPHTLVIHTDVPYPLLPNELATWGILSAESNGVSEPLTYDRNGCDGVESWPRTASFNDGSSTIGTGPFRFVEFVPGDRLVLARNPDHYKWDVEWETVTFKPITNDAARVAALLAGDVDFINNPPTQDLPRLETDDAVAISAGLSNRVIYLHIDQFGPATPGVTGTGEPETPFEGEGACAERACEKNPFHDKRVREALSKSIDRQAIVDRIMGGIAVPAGELLPPSFFGANADAQPTVYDPDAAKALLAEAGYADGFSLVVGTPNDRYINDARVAQAVAQFFTRIGIRTTIDATTASVFFSRRNKYEFSVYLAGWGAGTGEMSSPLRALVATRDRDRGLGGTNRGRYSNPDFDEMVLKALATVDDAERAAILQAASRMAMEDYAILPLHYEVTPWAHRVNLTYTPRADQYTIAMDIRSVD